MESSLYTVGYDLYEIRGQTYSLTTTRHTTDTMIETLSSVSYQSAGKLPAQAMGVSLVVFQPTLVCL